VAGAPGAPGSAAELTADHDGVIVEDIVAEWAAAQSAARTTCG
jgi:hypothetical protein